MELTTETKPCECGKKMILRRLNHVLATYPPQYPQEWWCGGCGRTENGPTLRGMTKEEMDMKEWESQQNDQSLPPADTTKKTIMILEPTELESTPTTLEAEQVGSTALFSVGEIVRLIIIFNIIALWILAIALK